MRNSVGSAFSKGETNTSEGKARDERLPGKYEPNEHLPEGKDHTVSVMRCLINMKLTFSQRIIF